MTDKSTSRWSGSKRSSKRAEIPSPAIGSPSAVPTQAKKVNTRKSPAWDPSKNPGKDATSSANVNELITSNQRAFAARFGGGAAAPGAPRSVATSSPSSASSSSSPTSMSGVTSTNPTASTPFATPASTSSNTAKISTTPAQQRQSSAPSSGAKPKAPTKPKASSKPKTPSKPKSISKQSTAKPPPPSSSTNQLAQAQRAAQQHQAKAAAIEAVANAEVKFKNGSTPLPLSNAVVARPGYAPVPASAILNVKKIGPPVVENRIGMGGLQSPVQVGGAGFNADTSSSKKSSSSRRRASSKKNSSKGGGGRWTKEEDQKLRAAVAAVGPQNWKMIAQDYLGEQRSDVQCLHRWQKVLQPGLVKGPWTKEEDQIIIDCIDAGITKWSEIAERIPGRIGKQCRERWFNHLDPSLKKGNWTEEEDAILVEAQAKWGNCWTKIAKLLPGRSENAVKNRWNSATRRRAKASQGPDAETKYLENLGDPNANMFPDGLDTTASAVLAAARAAAAKIIAEENGKIEPEDDDPDTIKLSHEAKTAMLMKKREYHQAQFGESSDEHLLLDEDGKPLIFEQDGHDVLPSFSTENKKDGKKSDMDINSSDFFHVPEDLAPKSGSNKKKSTKKKTGGSRSRAQEKKEVAQHMQDTASTSFLFFEDQNLTEREKDLIHRAYLAGLASKGDPLAVDAMKKARRKGAGSPSKRGKKGGNAAVQWDFNMEGSTSGSGSGFGMEHVLHQHLDEDDPSLNHSLLNMSLDKDMILDEMGLSLSDKSVLTRPLSSGAMNSLHVNPIVSTPSSSNEGSAEKKQGSNAARGNEDGGSGSKWKKKSGGTGEGVSAAVKMSPTATMLSQITSNDKDGLITEDEMEQQKKALLVNVKKGGGGGETKEAIDPDLLDPDQSVDLSTDLAQFIGSPNLVWSLSHSNGSASGAGLSPVPVGATTAQK